MKNESIQDINNLILIFTEHKSIEEFDMYYSIFYQNGKYEEYEGKFTNYPCSLSSIKLIVEYLDGKIINCFNPNDI